MPLLWDMESRIPGLFGLESSSCSHEQGHAMCYIPGHHLQEIKDGQKRGNGEKSPQKRVMFHRDVEDKIPLDIISKFLARSFEYS